MRARAYCVHPSLRDHWILRCMSRCPDQVVSLKRKYDVAAATVDISLLPGKDCLVRQAQMRERDRNKAFLRRRGINIQLFARRRDDEAHFWLNGYVNKQNCRIWSEANPQVYVETPLHPEKLTVGALYGRVESFFKNDEGHNVTVNGDRHRAMITNFFIPELNNHDVQELWFQQDGATCHTAHATIDLLKDKFGDRLISRFGPVNWPPRSCDLTPLDYFLWGYVKSLVYADKPQTLDHLEDNIRRVIADIRPQMLEKVIENWTSRLDYIRASRGSPMPEIIFKM
ncbi:putative transposable element [Trichonephila clavipes]|nr:putative transposable element [Trichonephila clavipes]